MNYYEELGLLPSASAEEIRQAYRELARLLHPDQHQEEGLRRAAERQMKRLNQVVAVLSDPAERRRYDLSLAIHRRGAEGAEPSPLPDNRHAPDAVRSVRVWH